MLRLALRQLAVLALASAVAGFHWPNPTLEAYDALRWDQAGAHSGLLGPAVTPCSRFEGTGEASGNQTNAAQWLRTAYHDMATYDAATGTGGLDGSIQYEVDRPENPGEGFASTFNFAQLTTNRYVSFSDGLAVAALTAVEACGGPKIDFRGGRVDAKQAGPPGVPQPQDTLQSHTAAFARMGFTPTEMIQLVACGHTIGGVQNAAFPDVAPASTVTDDNPDGNMVFDQTFAAFDNHIATAYVSGQSVDPLVVGPNVTTRSDARIFASDGNATIAALAKSPGLFLATCGALLARMLDTVPRDVVLTEVIEPLPVKPADLSLIMHSDDNSFLLSASVRFWNLDAASNATVRLLWADNSGKPCVGCAVPLAPLFRGNVGIAFAGNHTALWFYVPWPGLTIGPAGISRFWFEVTARGRTWVENQGGTGFPLQTDVVVSDSSCVDYGDDKGHLDIAVRKGRKPSHVYLAGPALDGSPARSESWPAVLNQSASLNNSAYDIYSLPLPSTLASLSQMNVGATFGGHNLSDWTSFSPSSNLRTC